LATAPFVHFAGWAPDSRWIAYWLSSKVDLDAQIPSTMPGGTLHFANVVTGESCITAQFVTSSAGEAEVHWSAEGEVIARVDADAFVGVPCQAEPFSAWAGDESADNKPIDPALSPDGRFRAHTTLQSSAEGVETFETALTSTNDT
jgi:hypothetical protein